MEEKNHILSFKTQVLRSPVNSLTAINAIPNAEDALDVFVRKLFRNIAFRESIFIASIELYHEWKSAYQDMPSVVKMRKLNKTILKYYVRSFSKCVPFGLFAHYGIIKPEHNQQEIQPDQLKRHLTFDSTFLSKIFGYLNSSTTLKEILRYVPNNTIYDSGVNLRFIETNIVGNSKNHSLSTIENDEVIALVREKCKLGLKKNEIVQLLMDNIEGIDTEETLDFVNELISSQVLVSTLDIQYNGDTAFQQIISFLRENANIINKDPLLNDWADAFEMIDDCVRHIEDCHTRDSLQYLEKIVAILKQYNIPFQRKNLLGINLKKGYKILSSSCFKDDETQLRKAIHLFSIFSPKSPENKNSSLSKLAVFTKAFLERYEDREIPLMKALDNELGIGYLQGNKDSALFSDLLDDLKLPAINPGIEKIQSEKVLDDFWFKVLLRATSNHDSVIDLKNEDLSKIESVLAPTCGTFSMVYSKIGNKISMVMSGGTSALNLISRFSSGDLELQDFIDEISLNEEEIFSDQIVAEIVHTPNVRAGNILSRKIKRRFEISILSPGSPEAIQITLDDLMVSIKNGKVFLRSIKHDKEVIPFLSSAQNFHYDSLPIFHFLCDMQAQYRSNVLSMNFNTLINRHFNYIPRITFGDQLVLSSATWKFRREQLSELLNQNGLLDYYRFKLFLSNNQVPKYIVLVEDGEESLIINTDNELMVSLLDDSLKKHDKLHFKECLYDIDNDPQQYCNEYIMSFKNDTRISVSRNKIVQTEEQLKFIPGDEWLYFKVYTGMRSADTLLIDTIRPIAGALIEKGLIDKWFFIRFTDPEFHLRIRFHFNKEEDKLEILNAFNLAMEEYIVAEIIWKIELSTYVRELERYGWDNITRCEELFFRDSDMISKLILELKHQNREHLLWIYCFLSINEFFNVFRLSLQQKNDLAISCYNYFAKEFQADKSLRKQLGAKFRKYLPEIEAIRSAPDDVCLRIIHDRNEKIQGLVSQMLDENKVTERLLSSFIHMTVNRAINSNARVHELVIYSLLEKYYKKKIASVPNTLNEYSAI